jgi:hypothetical protein
MVLSAQCRITFEQAAVASRQRRTTDKLWRRAMERAHFILPTLALALTFQRASAGLRNVSCCRLLLHYESELHPTSPAEAHALNLAGIHTGSFDFHVRSQFVIDSITRFARRLHLPFQTTLSKALLFCGCETRQQKRAKCVPLPSRAEATTTFR